MALNLPKRPVVHADATESVSAPITRRPSAPRNGNQPANHASTFVRADKELTRRIIISLTGEEKSGKNHTAFTAPAPIYVHSFDIGLDGVVQKFQREKDIYIADYELTIQPGEATPTEVANAAEGIWTQFMANYRDGLASCGGGTTVIDTDTEAWELLRLARFGKIAQVQPHHYGPVNAEFRDLVREGYDHDANVFLLSKKTPIWENYVDASGKERGRKTGEMGRKGFADLPFLVQVVATTNRDGSDFTVTIEDCRMNPEANGQTIPNDYEFIMSTIFGD